MHAPAFTPVTLYFLCHLAHFQVHLMQIVGLDVLPEDAQATDQALPDSPFVHVKLMHPERLKPAIFYLRFTPKHVLYALLHRRSKEVCAMAFPIKEWHALESPWNGVTDFLDSIFGIMGRILEDFLPAQELKEQTDQFNAVIDDLCSLQELQKPLFDLVHALSALLPGSLRKKVGLAILQHPDLRYWTPAPDTLYLCTSDPHALQYAIRHPSLPRHSIPMGPSEDHKASPLTFPQNQLALLKPNQVLQKHIIYVLVEAQSVHYCVLDPKTAEVIDGHIPKSLLVARAHLSSMQWDALSNESLQGWTAIGDVLHDLISESRPVAPQAPLWQRVWKGLSNGFHWTSTQFSRCVGWTTAHTAACLSWCRARIVSDAYEANPARPQIMLAEALLCIEADSEAHQKHPEEESKKKRKKVDAEKQSEERKDVPVSRNSLHPPPRSVLYDTLPLNPGDEYFTTELMARMCVQHPEIPYPWPFVVHTVWSDYVQIEYDMCRAKENLLSQSLPWPFLVYFNQDQRYELYGRSPQGAWQWTYLGRNMRPGHRPSWLDLDVPAQSQDWMVSPTQHPKLFAHIQRQNAHCSAPLGDAKQNHLALRFGTHYVSYYPNTATQSKQLKSGHRWHSLQEDCESNYAVFRLPIVSEPAHYELRIAPDNSDLQEGQFCVYKEEDQDSLMRYCFLAHGERQKGSINAADLRHAPIYISAEKWQIVNNQDASTWHVVRDQLVPYIAERPMYRLELQYEAMERAHQELRHNLKHWSRLAQLGLDSEASQCSLAVFDVLKAGGITRYLPLYHSAGSFQHLLLFFARRPLIGIIFLLIHAVIHYGSQHRSDVRMYICLLVYAGFTWCAMKYKVINWLLLQGRMAHHVENLELGFMGSLIFVAILILFYRFLAPLAEHQPPCALAPFVFLCTLAVCIGFLVSAAASDLMLLFSKKNEYWCTPSALYTALHKLLITTQHLPPFVLRASNQYHMISAISILSCCIVSQLSTTIAVDALDRVFWVGIAAVLVAQMITGLCYLCVWQSAIRRSFHASDVVLNLSVYDPRYPIQACTRDIRLRWIKNNALILTYCNACVFLNLLESNAFFDTVPISFSVSVCTWLVCSKIAFHYIREYSQYPAAREYALLPAAARFDNDPHAPLMVPQHASTACARAVQAVPELVLLLGVAAIGCSAWAYWPACEQSTLGMTSLMSVLACVLLALYCCSRKWCATRTQEPIPNNREFNPLAPRTRFFSNPRIDLEKGRLSPASLGTEPMVGANG